MSGSEQGVRIIFTTKLIELQARCSFLLIPCLLIFFLNLVFSFAGTSGVSAQVITTTPRLLVAAPPYIPQPSAPIQPNAFNSGYSASTNYLKNSVAFRQEIARMEINVARGDKFLPITQVPRVQKDDVIKVRLLDEAVGGIKLDQSNWNWTFLVAFVNPNRNQDKEKSVSEEIQFRKSGWYKEYSFTVPYDSQPVFFLYPKPKYREKILKLIGEKFEEVQKLGDKTIELAGAYAQIGSFLNELQGVLYQTQSSRYAGNNGSYNSYNPYGINNPYNPIGGVQQPNIPFNYNAFIEQTIERLARSFNIQLPSCWQSSGSYNSYGSSSYNSNGGYGGYMLGSSSNANNFGYQVSQDLIGRAQCVARNIRIEDFDFSVSQLLKQGGILAATQLRDKYPQIAYWINLAAAALDFIVKAFQKSPLRIVPTIVQSNDNQLTGVNGNGINQNYQTYQNNPYQNNYASNPMSSPGSPNGVNAPQQPPVKISLFAESVPSDNNGFVTAYPIVVQKWQPVPDPEVISLYPPVLSDPCLHAGVNILKSTSIGDEPAADIFTKDFRLVMTSTNSFKKEFPLKKNAGAGGWELNLTKEDLNSFPKVEMRMESYITGRRGFNELKSPSFDLPVSLGGTYEITPESQKAFTVSGKRTVTLRNPLGGCQCLQAVIYKPSFGGQFVFEANAKDKNNQLQFSSDGRTASFEIDAGSFQPGAGQLEIRTFGGEVSNVGLKLYPQPPVITDVKISKGDRYAIITGERLEQLQSVKINGKKAVVAGAKIPTPASQPFNPNINQNQTLNLNQNQNINNQFPDLNLNLGQNQKAFIFEDQSTRQTSGTVSIELGLEDDRSYPYPQTFTAGPARPTIAANDENEIEGTFVDNSNTVNSKNRIPQIDISKYPVVGISAAALSIVVKNRLTDYEFKGENLSIETRIEKSQPGTLQPPQVGFDVLDGNTLRLNFNFNEQSQKFIGGRRLQFRIHDKERGDSDWYTVRQTFVRIPEIKSVKCTPEMNGMCQMTGDGIDYIQQVSVDGGASWYPQDQSGLTAQPAPDGQKMALIPLLTDKKLLQIKLRDFPKTVGLPVSNFTFSNSVKAGAVKKNQTSPPPLSPTTTANGNAPAASASHPSPVQNGNPVTNQSRAPDRNFVQPNQLPNGYPPNSPLPGSQPAPPTTSPTPLKPEQTNKGSRKPD